MRLNLYGGRQKFNRYLIIMSWSVCLKGTGMIHLVFGWPLPIQCQTLSVLKYSALSNPQDKALGFFVANCKVYQTTKKKWAPRYLKYLVLGLSYGSSSFAAGKARIKVVGADGRKPYSEKEPVLRGWCVRVRCNGVSGSEEGDWQSPALFLLLATVTFWGVSQEAWSGCGETLSQKHDDIVWKKITVLHWEKKKQSSVYQARRWARTKQM